MPAWLTGLLGGVNQASDANRAERLRKEEQQERFERDLLTKIADDPQYTTEVRTRAATGLLELAQGTRKRPRGGFLSRLTGVDPIEAHPAVSEIFRFMQGAEEKGGGLPTGLARTAPPPQPVPGSAAMPTTPASQPGGGPPSPGQLPSPGGPPPSDLPTGALPINEATGAGPQGPPSPSVQVPRQIMRTPQEMAIEAAEAREMGEVMGEVKGYVAAGMSQADALALARARRLRAAGQGAGNVQALRGTLPDGTLAWGILDRRPGSPTQGKFLDEDGQPLIGFRPAATSSISMATDREAIAAAEFGKPYSGLTQPQQQRVLQLEKDMLRGEAFNRTLGGNQAEIGSPVAQATKWQKELAADRTAREAYGQMAIAMRRYQEGDKIGGVEGVRVGFAKIFDKNSVVREGEFNRQTYGLSGFDYIRGKFQAYLDGGGDIPVDVLQEMVTTAQQVAQLQTQFLPKLAREITEHAGRWGYNPRDVLGSYQIPGVEPTPPGPPPAPAPAAPAAAPAPPAPAPGMAGAPPPAPTATRGVALPPMAPMSSREGTPPQGGPPAIPAEVPPGAPQQGQMVGNRWTGPVRFNYRTQRWLGEMPDGSLVALTKTPAGDFLY